MTTPIEYSLKVRREAPLHIQLQIETISTQAIAGDGQVVIEGRTVRVFRSPSSFALGDRVGFPIFVCRKKDGPPTGPAYVYREDLLTATHVEAYLYGAPPHCRLGAYELMLLTEPSDTPCLTVAHLEAEIREWERTPKRWWQFWRSGR